MATWLATHISSDKHTERAGLSSRSDRIAGRTRRQLGGEDEQSYSTDHTKSRNEKGIGRIEYGLGEALPWASNQRGRVSEVVRAEERGEVCPLQIVELALS